MDSGESAYERRLDEARATNLFLVLGKYVERQDENLLTQALVLLFNRVQPFRDALAELLFGRAAFVRRNSDELVAFSQVGRRTHGGRIWVDMEIRRRNDHRPLFLIESKLDAGLGLGQIKNYRSALKQLPGSPRFVILTRYGIDSELQKYCPKNTVWVPWSVVAEVATSCMRRTSRLNQFLLQDFLQMAKLKGISEVPGMTVDSLKALNRFTRFSYDKVSWLNHKSVLAVDLAFQRMKEHRDYAWESMFAGKSGWSPYQSVYRLDEKYLVLQAGFYRYRPHKNVQESYLGLDLECGSIPKLSIIKGWKLSPGHPRYDRDNPHEGDSWGVTKPSTRKLFKMPMLRANLELVKDLRKLGTSFLKSKYAR